MQHALIVVLVLFAIFASRAVLFFPGPPSMDWGQLIARLTTDWFVWLLLAPAIVWLTRRFPFRKSTWVRSAFVHLLAAIVAGGLHAFLRLQLGATIMWMPYAPLRMLMYAQAHINFLTYWSIVAATTAFDGYERYREREDQALRLEAQLARAQVDALSKQLQPHFLFNTMNAISAFMHEDVERADRMLNRLSDLLRHTLQHFDAAETRLKEELNFLDQYLQIQQERFGPRLRVSQLIDPTAEEALVPPLILQPIVENAIQHGIADKLEGGQLSITATLSDGRLKLVVDDDGPGFTTSTPERTGVGIANTRARLEQIYGSEFLFEFGNSPNGGARVIIEIPFRT